MGYDATNVAFYGLNVKNSIKSIDGLKDALTSGTLSYEDYIARVNAANMAMAKSPSAISSIVSSLKGFGIAMIASLAIQGIATIIDNIIHAQEKASEAAKNSFASYQNAKSEVANLNSELATTQARIDELKAKGPLTLIEQQELNNLQTLNNQLEEQIVKKQMIADYAGIQSATDAAKALNVKSQKVTHLDDKGLYDYAENVDQMDAVLHKLGEIEYYKNKIEADRITAADVSLDQGYRDQATDDIEHSTEAIAELDEEIIKLVDLVNTDAVGLFDEFGNAVPGFEDFVAKFETMNNEALKYYMGNDDWSSMKLNQILNQDQFSSMRQELIALGRDGSLSIELLQSRFPGLVQACSDAGIEISDLLSGVTQIAKTGANASGYYFPSLEQISTQANNAKTSLDILNTAISEQNSTGSLSSETYSALIAANSDYAKVIEYTSTGLQLNAQKANELADANNNLAMAQIEAAKVNAAEQYKRNTEAIDRYTKTLDEASNTDEKDAIKTHIKDLQDENKELTALIPKYDQLSSSLRSSINKYAQWQNAKNTVNSGHRYDEVVSGIEQTKQLYNEKMFGNDDFRTFVDLMSFEDMASASIPELQAAYENGIKQWEGYYASGSEGINRFLNDVKSYGTAKQDEFGFWSLQFDPGQDIEAAQALGMSVEGLHIGFEKLKEYGHEIHFDFGNEGKSMNTLVKELENGTTASSLLREAVAGINRSDLDLSNLGNLSTVVSEIKSAESEYRRAETAKNYGYDVDALQSYADTYLKMQSQYLTDPYAFLSSDSLEENMNRLTEAKDFLMSLPEEVREAFNIDLSDWDASILNGTIPEIDFNAEDAISDMDALRMAAESAHQAMMEDSTGENIDRYKAYADIINSLPEEVRSKYHLDISQVDTGFVDIQSLVEDCNAAVETMNTVDIDINSDDFINAQEMLTTISGTIATMDPVLKVSLGFSENDTAESIHNKLANKEVQIPASLDVSSSQAGKAALAVAAEAINSIPTPPIKLEFKADLSKANATLASYRPVIDAFVNINFSGTSSSSSNTKGKVTLPSLGVFNKNTKTTEAQGSALISNYANGTWSLPTDETALVNELGTELVVRNGHFFTIPGGAQFTNLKRGDIIFNHKQTKELLNYGRIRSHGRAIAEGTVPAFNSSDYVSTIAASTVKEIKEASENFKEVVNWMERLVQNIDDYISHLKSATKYYQTYREQNPLINETIANLKENLAVQKRMYDRYMAQANASGLSDTYKRKIQSGDLDISTITDEALKNQIDDYQQWYDLAEKVKTELIDINTEMRDLAAKKLTNIKDDFENLISLQDAYLAKAETLLKLNEMKGTTSTESDYTALISRQSEIGGYLKGQHAALKAEFDALMAQSLITLYDDEYYKWMEELSDLEEAIYKNEIAIQDFKGSIRDIRWQPFEKLNDSLDNLSSTLSDIDDLINDSALFDDNGQYGNAAYTRFGLLGQQLSIAKQQAAEYTQAMADLDKELANGVITQETYDKEMVKYAKSQRDAADATAKTRKAILNLIKDGIKEQTSALKELISTKKADLKASKDYEDYQSELNEKQAEIQAKKAQMAAIEGNEKKRSEYLKLQKELQKLEDDYNKTKKDHEYDLLMEGYDMSLQTFEEIQDEKLKTLETDLAAQNEAINEALQTASANYEEVYGYLTMLSDVYGIALTDDIVNPWKSAENAVNAYVAAMEKASAKTNTNTSAINTPESSVKSTPAASEKNSTIESIVHPQTDTTPAPAKPNIWNGIPASPATKGASWLAIGTSIMDRMKWNGYVGEYSTQRTLYNNLNGAAVHGTYGGSAAQNVWLINQLKSAGFKEGGIARLVRQTGEEGIGLVRNGEGFVAPEHVRSIQQLIDNLPILNDLASGLSRSRAALTDHEATPQLNIHYDNLINVQGNIDKSVVIDIERFARQFLDSATSHTVQYLRTERRKLY